ncbi:ABC transporter permease [Streptomyces sp. NPDC047002]|uniref:ABC transporter permease n=1 Tax=Streptomyces sp. NPDC047002 TaxID=3155475 RepID=UPI0034536A53
MTTFTKTDAVQVEAAAEPLGARWNRRLGGGWIFPLLILLFALFAALRPGQFATPFNLSTLAVDASILLVLSIGQTYVIATAGIDLSVGTVLVLSSVVGAKAMLALSGTSGAAYGTTAAGWGVIALGTLAAVAAGAVFGALNGVLVAYARIPALIVTLGTFGMALGFAQLLSDGQDVRAVPQKLVAAIGSGKLIGIPSLVWVALAVTVVGGLVLHTTRFGSRTFAVGSNAEAARRAGIPNRSHLVKVYLLSGALAGLAGIMSVARFATTTINGHTTDNLSSISAVVLGGTSLFGGIGSIFGTVVGVFIPIILLNGFVILGIQPFWQTVAMGAVLIVAVYADQLKRHAAHRGERRRLRSRLTRRPPSPASPSHHGEETP